MSQALQKEFGQLMIKIDQMTPLAGRLTTTTPHRGDAMPTNRNRDEDGRGERSDHRPADWIAAAKAGDAESLGRALEGCRDDLRRRAEASLGADLAAKVGASDLVQETFLTAHRDFAGFRGSDEATFRGWLKAILQHRLADAAECYRTRGKRKLDREVSLDVNSPCAQLARQLADTTTSPSERATRVEEKLTIRTELDRLPTHYRDALVLRYWERLDFEAIGARLHVSSEAARKLCDRALTKLDRSIRAPHGSR